jgi:hypothetical protein
MRPPDPVVVAARAAAKAKTEAEAAEVDPVERPPRPLAARVLSSWRKLDRMPGVRWVKRVVAFPIGERFAVISLTAALFTPRTTFIVVLAWGTFALIYSLAGRLLRSLR